MFVLYLLLFCASTLAYVSPPPILYDLEDAENIFEEFIKKFNKVYADEEEKQERLNNFKENLRKINELRLSEYGKQNLFEINHLSDWTVEEFTSIYLSGEVSGPMHLVPEPVNATMDLPDSFDWRTEGVVGPVKNQDRCGACWAFSTTGTIEGAYAIKHKNLLSFSEQQLIDCDKDDGGCGGGSPFKAILYIQSAGGLELESDYPFEIKDDICRFDSNKVQVQILGEKAIDTRNPDALKQALIQVGPISVGIHADDSWHHYPGGIWPCATGGLNHAVLLVGYGTENGVPYWTFKNSWGATWGEQGYVRVPQSKPCSMDTFSGVIPIIA